MFLCHVTRQYIQCVTLPVTMESQLAIAGSLLKMSNNFGGHCFGLGFKILCSRNLLRFVLLYFSRVDWTAKQETKGK